VTLGQLVQGHKKHKNDLTLIFNKSSKIVENIGRIHVYAKFQGKCSSSRVIVTKNLGDDAKNNTTVATAASHQVVQLNYKKNTVYKKIHNMSAEWSGV